MKGCNSIVHNIGWRIPSHIRGILRFFIISGFNNKTQLTFSTNRPTYLRRIITRYRVWRRHCGNVFRINKLPCFFICYKFGWVVWRAISFTIKLYIPSGYPYFIWSTSWQIFPLGYLDYKVRYKILNWHETHITRYRIYV